jgi:hypothetical protein
MHFDDGANPWMLAENHIKIFRYGNAAASFTLSKGVLMVVILLACF